MKKKNMISAAALSMALSLCLCSISASAETDGDNINFVKAISEVNSPDALISKYGQFEYLAEGALQDGTDISMTYYYDNSKFVGKTDVSTIVVEDNDIFGYNDLEDKYFRYLIIGDFDEAAKALGCGNFFEYEGTERLLSKETEDGTIYAQIENNTVDDEVFQSWGFEEGSVDRYLEDFVIDEDTKEVLKTTASAVVSDKTIEFETFTLNTDCDEYVIDEDMKENVFGDDVRTVTLITDAGTEDEKTYSQTITKGNIIYFYLGDKYEDTLYEDPECTVELEITDDSADYTVYAKRIAD